MFVFASFARTMGVKRRIFVYEDQTIDIEVGPAGALCLWAFQGVGPLPLAGVRRPAFARDAVAAGDLSRRALAEGVAVRGLCGAQILRGDVRRLRGG